MTVSMREWAEASADHRELTEQEHDDLVMGRTDLTEDDVARMTAVKQEWNSPCMPVNDPGELLAVYGNDPGSQWRGGAGVISR